MATNKKFRIQNGANIQGELSFDNVTVIDSDGLVAAASVQPAVQSIVDTTFVNGLNVTAFDALSAQSVTDISSFTTTDISEGASLYFTAQRARDAIQAGVGVSYDPATGEISASLTGGEGISVSGDEVSFDGSSISQDIVPSVDNLYSLGSPDKVWRDVYIGPGSLYINGTKILEDNNGTITMYADPGQVLSFGTSGGGNIDFNAGDATIDFKSDMVMLPGKTISTSGGNPTEFGGDVDMSGNCIFNVNDPLTDGEAANKGYVDSLVNGSHAGDKTFSDNVVVGGNLTVQGTTTTVNSETISLADNIIDLNSNVTSGTPSENGGMRVMRGDLNAAQVRWNEANDHWEMYDGSSWTKIAVSTSDLEEGSNLYFTEQRVDAIVGPIESALQSDIADEAAARAAADTAEATARANADTALQDQIDSLEGSVQALPIQSGDSDTLDAAKTYADTQDAATLVSAKAYSDNKEVSLQQEISSGDSALNDAIVSGDSATLVSAKAYTDTAESALEAKDAAQDVAIQANSDAIAQEVLDRTAGDNQLQSAIDSLTSGLADARTDFGTGDSALNDAIQAVDSRVDGILAGSTVDLDSLKEIVDAFEGADGSLQGVIDNNTARLNTAESDINALELAMASRVSEIGNIEVDISDVDAKVTQEIVDRAVGDTALNGRVDNETAARIAGDSDTLAAAKTHADNGDASLQSQLDSLQGSVQALPIESGDSDTLDAAKAYTDTKVAEGVSSSNSYADGIFAPITNIEIPGLEAADSDLDVRVTALEAEDVSLSGRLDSDRLEWIGADSALDARVTTLETEMDTVEGRLDSDRLEWIGADSDLNAKIEAETSRATGVEGGLQSQINNILSNTDETALNSLSEIVSAFQSADGTLTGLVSANAADINTLEADVSSLQAINAGGRLNTVEGTLVVHDNRIGTLESEMNTVEQGLIDLPGQVKQQLSGGLCITYSPVTGVIEIDETEVRNQLVTHDADHLGGNDPSHYRINVYRVDGTLVN